MKIVILLFAFTLSFNMANSQTKKKKTVSKSSSVYYSEEKALELIADYYDFYNADEEYSDPKVRRVSNNVFYVAVKYCSGGKEICYEENSDGEAEKKEFFWNSKVLILRIQSSTKYTVDVKYD